MLQTTDAALFGAITSKPKEEAAKELAPELQNGDYVYFSPIVRLRQHFNLHTNLRPCKAYPGNPLNLKEGIDVTVFRENTEGMYGGIEFHPIPEAVYNVLDSNHPKMKRFHKYGLDNLALSTRIVSRQASERIIRNAFAYARKHGKKAVTVCDKPNVLRETGGLFVRTAREVALNFPGIELWETNIDAQTMWLVKNPTDYEVIVAENMFGDILSDLAAQLVGGLGFASSGNIGDDFAVFEPTHGSAPKYYGQNKVNPIAMMLSARMMLDWLGEEELAARLEKAIADVIAAGEYRTYDMGGNNTNIEVTDAVIRALSN
jgi:isocitrate/isopropylmalate dehydrogenase